jgi:uncharacterized low-complexity protein
MQIQKVKKLIKFTFAATLAVVLGGFLSVPKSTDVGPQSVRLDFDTEKAAADTPDSGSGSGDSGSGSGDSGSGSGDCGSGDCGG